MTSPPERQRPLSLVRVNHTPCVGLCPQIDNPVAPLSILSNWEKQIEDHCVTGTLSTCTYYGNNRNMTAQDLQKYDIVITTYQNVTGEHGNLNSESGGKKKRKIEQALFDVNWKVC